MVKDRAPGERCAAADGHAKAPRRGSRPLEAPAAAAKKEQLTRHVNQANRTGGGLPNPVSADETTAGRPGGGRNGGDQAGMRTDMQVTQPSTFLNTLMSTTETSNPSAAR